MPTITKTRDKQSSFSFILCMGFAEIYSHNQIKSNNVIIYEPNPFIFSLLYRNNELINFYVVWCAAAADAETIVKCVFKSEQKNYFIESNRNAMIKRMIHANWKCAHFITSQMDKSYFMGPNKKALATQHNKSNRAKESDRRCAHEKREMLSSQFLFFGVTQNQ